jgi:DNA end-binding protein Ku
MAARALWKAVLRLEGISVPIRMYSALHDRDIHFHLLHASDGVRVRERFVTPDTKHALDSEHRRAGYALESGDWVILDAEERDALAPAASRDIAVIWCGPNDALPLSAYARPYWLGPDGDTATYFALAQSLERSEQQALVEWVMRGRHHFGALQGRSGHLLLIDLRSADEWVDPASFELPEGRPLDKREHGMAEQLINALAGEFDYPSFHDEYRARVQALIEDKAKGVHAPRRRTKQPERAATTSLASALSASLRSVQRAGGGTRARSHAHASTKERKSA